MKRVAAQMQVQLVDLHAVSFQRYNELRDAGSAYFSAPATDRTHFSRKGGIAIARLFASA